MSTTQSPVGGQSLTQPILPSQPTQKSKPALWRATFVYTGALLLVLTFGMAHWGGLFAAWFPQLDRPIYAQESFAQLLSAHVWIVMASSLISVVLGVGLGLWVTRHAGSEFKPLIETVVAMGQTFPPVAVLAIAAPLIGFGWQPALIALALYGLLPIVQSTIAGFGSVSRSAMEAATGLGMSRAQRLWKVEFPLALPVIVSGIRTSVTINIGTAAIASTVGAKTLGTPIIVGLTGYNMAYVLQGAVLVGLLAITVDLAFDYWLKRMQS